MQKMDLSGIGKVYLINTVTGEKTLLGDVTNIEVEPASDTKFPEVLICSSESLTLSIPPEVTERLNKAFDDISEKGQKICDSIKAMLKDAEEAEHLLEGKRNDCLEDDKTPNPIYILKHIQHRKKGRR